MGLAKRPIATVCFFLMLVGGGVVRAFALDTTLVTRITSYDTSDQVLAIQTN
jgi:hypothetical protein